MKKLLICFLLIGCAAPTKVIAKQSSVILTEEHLATLVVQLNAACIKDDTNEKVITACTCFSRSVVENVRLLDIKTIAELKKQRMLITPSIPQMRFCLKEANFDE